MASPDEVFVKSPAFQIYPAEFLADANTMVMSATEIGAYCLLLFVCWRENGLPDDEKYLSSIARLRLKQFRVVWATRLERCFVKRADGKWTHKRLEKERAKQAENRAKRQDAGQKGANARWQTDGNAISPNGNGSTVTHDPPIATDSLAVCSLQSSIAISTEVKRERPAKTQDERARHPALVAVREVKGKFPNKDVWDLVIATVGEHPNVPKMRECWVAWRAHDYGPENLGWLVDWYVHGIPARNGNGHGLSKAERSQQAVANLIAQREKELRDGRAN